ncbi:hypothetical protein V7124_20615 [Neobacillus niacini]|uniref:hypothetical protein n=1 Tax=Neobacillus niacini TaxID=86668 RepID=UPI002FFE1D1E
MFQILENSYRAYYDRKEGLEILKKLLKTQQAEDPCALKVEENVDNIKNQETGTAYKNCMGSMNDNIID